MLHGATVVEPDIAQEGCWRAAMSGHGFRYGVIVSGHARRDGAVGTKDLHDAVEADARVLAVQRSRQGERDITWKEMRERVRREELGADWKLPGPRTALWCIEYILRHALQVDQLDGSNFECVGSMFRRLQTIEFVHGERARARRKARPWVAACASRNRTSSRGRRRSLGTSWSARCC